MPRTRVVFYREADGSVPVLEWFDGLPARAQDKCRVRIQRLAEMGHELRRPEADLLRDGIHELRVGLQHVNYRILYLSRATRRCARVRLDEADRVPDAAIATALVRKQQYEQGPNLHTFEES